MEGSRVVPLKSLTFGFTGFAIGVILLYVTLVSRIRLGDKVVYGKAGGQRTGDWMDDFMEGLSEQEVTSSLGQTNTTSPSQQLLTWDDIQKERRSLVRHTCESLSAENTMTSPIEKLLGDNPNILVDPKHQLLFCAIPKAACSSWRVALALLTGKVADLSTVKTVHSPYFLRSIGLPATVFLSPDQLHTALADFTSFLVVRHPLERLLSAFRDKFQTYNRWTRHFQQKFGRQIVRRYRGQEASQEALARGHDVTFSEFLTFITDESVTREERMNPHWESYQRLCHPCHLTYTHILKFETFSEDHETMLRRYLNSTGEEFPRRNSHTVPSGDLLAQYYSTVPAHVLRKVLAVYRADMDMFSYDTPRDVRDVL